jgi:Putative binding domain, N-terminal
LAYLWVARLSALRLQANLQRDGEVLVVESALRAMAVERLSFTVEGPATYAEALPAFPTLLPTRFNTGLSRLISRLTGEPYGCATDFAGQYTFFARVEPNSDGFPLAQVRHESAVQVRKGERSMPQKTVERYKPMEGVLAASGRSLPGIRSGLILRSFVAGLVLLGAGGLHAQTLDNQSVTLGADGGTWALNLTTGAAWTATANTPFLHINGGAAGVGNTTILFSADPWTGTANRTGSLTVAGLTVAVTQLPARAKVPGLATLASVINIPGSPFVPLVAADGSGNIFFSQSPIPGYAAIGEFNGGTHKTSTIISVLTAPAGLTTDSSGNVYVTDTATNTLWEWTAPGPGKPKPVLTAKYLKNPLGLAFDPRGLVGTLPLIHIANNGDSNLLGWNPAAVPVTVVEASVAAPLAVSYGPFGVVFSDGAGQIRTSTGTVLASGLATTINSLAQDSTGIYFTDGSEIRKLVPSSGQVTQILSSLNSAIAMDSNGDLVVQDMFGIEKLNTGTPSESLGTTSLTVGSAGGSQSVGIDFIDGYFTAPWSASTTATWLHLTSGGGKGPATLLFTVDANPAASPRSANIVLDSGLVLTVTQAGTNYSAVHSLTTLLSGISGRGVALDSSDNLYLVNYGANAIDVWNASTQQLTPTVTSGLSAPGGVAVDSAGNLYISDTGDNAVKKWSAATLTTLVPGLNQPYGVAVDVSGNVSFSDQLNDAIKQRAAATGAVSTLASGLNLPAGVAVDGSGNIYFADRNNNAVKMWSSSTLTVSTLISSGLTSPYGVAVDGFRNLYIGDSTSAIKVWSAATEQITSLGPAETGYGAAVDRLGGVYATAGGASVLKLTSAFLNAAPIIEPASAVSATLAPVLPVGTPLNGILAPRSDQAWLTIGSIANGLVGFSLIANTSGTARTAHITLLGQSITVTQADITLKAQAGSTPQSAHGNTAFANPVAVVVTNGSGSAVAGVNVTFTAPASGASGKFSNNTATITVATNASGVASAPFTANGTGGQYIVTAVAGVSQTVNFVLENTGEATSMLPNPGSTPQSAMVGTAFPNPVAVIVRDVVGNPVAGVNVIFTAPASGASGKFSNNTASITVATNVAGVASAAFTANTVAGVYTVTAAVAGTPLTAGFSLTNNAGVPASIVPNPGTTPQSVAIGAMYSFSVTVKDVYGNPVPWVNVLFSDASWQALFGYDHQGTSSTGPPNGVASATATAYGSPGTFPLTVTAGKVTITLTLTNLGPPYQIKTSGPQSAPPSTTFASPLQVTVSDSAGDLLPGLSVTFTAPAVGPSGTFSNGTNTITVTTNASGVASVVFKSNATIGPYQVSVVTPGLPAMSFSMANHGPVTSLTANPVSTGQWAEISTAFPNPLTVTATDSGGNAVPGLSVTFTAPASGPSGTFSNHSTSITIVTDGGGVASATFTANAVQSTSGPAYVVTASAGILHAGLGLINVGRPLSIVRSSGGGPVQINHGILIYARVVDSFLYGVPGAVVTLSVPTSGPSGLFSNGTNTITTTCDYGGNFVANLTANGTIGIYSVTVSTPGVPSLTISVRNVGNPASMTVNSGASPQSAHAYNAFGVGLGVTIRDSFGSPVPGVTVTFTAPASGPSGTITTYLNPTDSNGVTAPQFTANAIVGGPYIVTAASAGVPTVKFSLTNLPSLLFITVNDPSTQYESAEISTAFPLPLGVTVTDSGGNVVPGSSVTFTAPTSGPSGTFSNHSTSITILTDSGGVASPTFTANAVQTGGGIDDAYNVTASVSPAKVVDFPLINVGKAVSITNVFGRFGDTLSRAQINHPGSVIVDVVDSEPYGVPGVVVTFTSPTSGASSLFSNGTHTFSTLCDHRGYCSANLIANGTPGGYSITASSPGIPSISLPMLNVGNPASMTATAGTVPQSAKISTNFAVQLAVTIRDASGLPVPGVTVVFTAPDSPVSAIYFGGTVFSIATDQYGVATDYTRTATGVAGGPYIVTAASTGFQTLNFSLTNLP